MYPKKFISILLCFFLFLTGITARETEDNTEMFRDVPLDHWAYDAIQELKHKGALIGYNRNRPGNLFKGEQSLTRYEFALALAKAMQVIEISIQDQMKDLDLESYLKDQNLDSRDIELLSMLIKEFKKELNSLDLRMIKLEERRKKAALGDLPVYLSIASVLVSLAALTVSIQNGK